MNQVNRQSKKNRSRYISPPIIISGVISLVLFYSGWLTKIENNLHENEAYLTKTQYDSDIVIVEIDHASLKALNKWPWQRRYYAEAINNLFQAQAKKVFLDIDFSANSNPEDDDIFASTLKTTQPGTVLMPTFVQYSDSGNSKYLSLSKPNTKFRPFVTPVSVNLTPDSDGMVRHAKILSSFADETLPTAAVIFSNYDAKPDEIIRLNLRIMPASFKQLSFHDIYSNDFDKGSIKDKYIIIGATALELRDQVPVPVYKSLSGPVLQAIIYQSLISGKLFLPSQAVTTATLLILYYPLLLLFSTRGWRKGLKRLFIVNLLVFSVSITLHAGFNIMLDISPLILFTTLSYIFLQFSKIDKQFYKILRQKVALNNKEAMMTHVIKNTSEGIILLDKDLIVTSANASACKIFTALEDDITGESINSLLPELTINRTFTHHQFETEALNNRGNKIPVEIILNKLNVQNAQIYTVFIHNISERKEQQAVLTYQVSHDALTGLNNRTYLLEKIQTAIENYNNTKQTATLIMIDLNNFKQINDALGHNTGDHILMTLGRNFKSLQDENTCVSRLGGDEFGILTTQSYGKDDMSAYIRKIHRLISEPIELSDMSLSIDAAIGVAHIPDHAETRNEILVAADIAMYKSKSSKQSYSIYDPYTDYHTKRNLAISNDIKQALANNQLHLQYQPKIDLNTHLVTGFEALIRWQHPTLGLILPDEFIPIVENSSLIKPVTIYTIETAIRKQKELHQAGYDLSIAINLSAKLLDDNNLADDITRLLSSYDVPPEKLTLEITESAAMKNHERTLIILNKLIKNNLKLSIDDFGTSHATFSYLKQLPATELKIDKLFITEICNDNSDKIITASIISLAHGLNMKVVAEGIEDRKTYEYLCELGCDIAQGYWISRALPDEEVISWITQWNNTKNIEAFRRGTH